MLPIHEWVGEGVRTRSRTASRRIRADELGFELGFSILEQHLKDLRKVLLQLIDRRALRMGTRRARHIADQEASIRVPLDHSRELMHTVKLSTLARPCPNPRRGSWPG